MNKIITVAAALLLSAASVHAQESELLKKYRTMALSYNQDVKAADKGVAYYKEMESSAKADMLPKVAANATASYVGNPMELSITLPSLGAFSFEGKHESYGTSVSMVQPVYTGGRNREQVKIAQTESTLSEDQAALTRSNVTFGTDYRYWNAVAAQEMVTATQQLEKSMENLVRVVRERVDAGLVNKNDLLMAEVKLNDARFQRKKAQDSFEVSRMALNSQIGVDLKAATAIDASIPVLRSTGSFAAEVEAALNNRAEVRIAQGKIAIQESAEKVKDSYYKPQLYLGAEGSYSSPGYNFKPDMDPNYAVYAKLSIPVFEWGKRKSSRRASSIRVDMAKENLNKVTDNVRLEAQSAYYSYSQAVEQVVLTENSLEKAKDNEQMALDRYKEGNLSILEALDAQLYYQAAQINHIRSRANAQIYYSEFVRALGKY
jgi:outer membrane protein TolC